MLYALERDAGARVAGITGPGFSESLGYDPTSLRVRRSVSGGPDERFHLEGEHLEAIYSPAGALKAKFLRGSVIDEVVNGYFFDASGKPANYTYHHDRLQSVVGLSGHAGSVEETLRYGPFGDLLASTGTSPSSLRCTGREHDPASGLYYYRARYYDPEIGRFLSEDPMGFDGGDVNLYAYVGNNPLAFTDPLGKDMVRVGVQGVAVGGGGGSLSGGIVAGVREAPRGAFSQPHEVGIYGDAAALGGFDFGIGIVVGVSDNTDGTSRVVSVPLPLPDLPVIDVVSVSAELDPNSSRRTGYSIFVGPQFGTGSAGVSKSGDLTLGEIADWLSEQFWYPTSGKGSSPASEIVNGVYRK